MLVLFGCVDGVVHIGTLGAIHRHIPAPQQSFGVASVLGTDGNSDACANLDAVALQLDRLPQHFCQVLCCHLPCLSGAVAQEHCELVAAKAGDHVFGRECVDQSLRSLLQQEIPMMMAEGVVDLFEAVQVHHEQGQGAVVLDGLLDGLRQLLPQQSSVGQTRQRIVEGLVL